MESDPVVVTARVVHAQAGAPVAAFAVAGEHIVATGTPDALRSRFPGATVEDFGDATLVPGFNDAHIHIGLTAEDLLHLDLSHAAVGTIDVLLDRIRHRAASARPGEWVRGTRYDDVKTGVLTRHDLDAAAGDVPTLVTHVAAHWGVVNSAGLAALGYREDCVNTDPLPGAHPHRVPPPGGDLGRDAAGRLDGRLIERALLDVAYAATATADSPIRPSTRDERLIGLRRAVEQWHAAGLTSICDALASPDDIALLHRARRDEDLTLRTGLLLGIDHYAKARELGIGSGFGDDHLRLVGVKSFVDGAIGGRTCLLSEPFTGTDYRGMQITGTEELRDTISQVHRDGNRMAVHANGDAAIRLLLDIYAALEPQPGPRHRIEHCSLIDDDILARMRALDLIAVPFAGYVAYHGGALESWYGKERVRRMFAHRSLLDAGVTVAGSSDYPCGPFEPLLGMQSMVTRRGLEDGALIGENQRITPAEALQIYTIGSAAASGDEHRKGRLAPGFLADFTVLERDPLAVDPTDIATIQVLHTYVGGRRVWTHR